MRDVASRTSTVASAVVVVAAEVAVVVVVVVSGDVVLFPPGLALGPGFCNNVLPSTSCGGGSSQGQLVSVSDPEEVAGGWGGLALLAAAWVVARLFCHLVLGACACGCGGSWAGRSSRALCCEAADVGWDGLARLVLPEDDEDGCCCVSPAGGTSLPRRGRVSTKFCGLSLLWLLLWAVVGSRRCGGVGGRGVSAAGIVGNPPRTLTSLSNLGRRCQTRS